MTEMLNEFSLSRLNTHITNNRPLAILTAFRGEETLASNRARNQKVKDKIRSFGLAFIPVKGGYVEKDEEGNAVEVKEESLIVIGDIGKGSELRRLAVKIGIDFQQDSVLFRDEKGATQLISTRDDGFVGKIGATQSLGKWAPNKLSDYFTELKGGSRFIFEEVEAVVRKPVIGFAEHMATAVNLKKFLSEDTNW